MKKVAIVTDSNSGITQKEASALGITVIPMPFLIDENEYFEDINLTQEEFYKKLEGQASISTSQPSIGGVMETWDTLLKTYDQIVHIPMSSALSKSCETAMDFAEKQYKDKVFVVDDHSISITQKTSVYNAQKMAEDGFDGAQIKKWLEDNMNNASIYIMVDTLYYLKKGGRVTPAAAAIGSLLNIKPVLQIQGGKLDSFAKVMNVKKAKTVMLNAIKKDLETRFATLYKNGEMQFSVAHTHNDEKAAEFAHEIEEMFGVKITFVDPLSLSVSCHIGPGALAMGVSRIYKK